MNTLKAILSVLIILAAILFVGYGGWYIFHIEGYSEGDIITIIFISMVCLVGAVIGVAYAVKIFLLLFYFIYKKLGGKL